MTAGNSSAVRAGDGKMWKSTSRNKKIISYRMVNATEFNNVCRQPRAELTSI